MKKSLRYREALRDARRIVVKIGTRVLAQKSGRPDTRRMAGLARQVAQLQRDGREVLIVTSGAIGAGMEALRMKERPTALPDLQMAAAVGQSRLMARYDKLFSGLGCIVGQVLLTHGDFRHKIRLTNARRTLENLLRHKVIPIINENDVVADEEIRADLSLGDNDYLAALVVKVVRADLLVLLTTVDGVREPGPNGSTRRIRYLEAITPSVFKLVRDSESRLSKGGMASKLSSVLVATKAGCAAVIASGLEQGILQRVIRGEDVGTIILPEAI